MERNVIEDDGKDETRVYKNRPGDAHVRMRMNPKLIVNILVPHGKPDKNGELLYWRFPVYKDDNLEKVVHRFEQMYPAEAAGFVAELQMHIKENEKGWSKANMMRFACSIPTFIYHAMKAIDIDFWKRDDNKGIKEFLALCPKLGTKGRI